MEYFDSIEASSSKSNNVSYNVITRLKSIAAVEGLFINKQ